MRTLITFTNFDDGVASHVIKLNAGFAVILEDVDAGRELPTSIICQTLHEAERRAATLVNVTL